MPTNAVNGIRLSISDIVVVLGVVWLSHACSTFGGGDFSGLIDADSGEMSGDFFAGYGNGERIQIILAATMIAVGALMKLSRSPQSDAAAGGWYPNRRQWWVIWIAFAATALLVFTPYVSGINALPLIIFVLIGAVLLVWQLSRR